MVVPRLILHGCTHVATQLQSRQWQNHDQHSYSSGSFPQPYLLCTTRGAPCTNEMVPNDYVSALPGRMGGHG